MPLRPPPPDDDEQGGSVAVAPGPVPRGTLRPPPSDEQEDAVARGLAAFDALNGGTGAALARSVAQPPAPTAVDIPNQGAAPSRTPRLSDVLDVPKNVINQGVVNTATGLYEAGKRLGMQDARAPSTGVNEALGIPNVTLGDLFHGFRGEVERQTDASLLPKTERFAGQALPFFVNPAVAGAAVMGNAEREALDAGATQAQADKSAALQGAAIAAAGPIGRVAAGAAAPLIRQAARIAAPAAPVLAHAVEGTAQGAVQSGAGVAGQSQYDPQGAAQALKDLPGEALTFGAVGAGTHAVPAVAGAIRDRLSDRPTPQAIQEAARLASPDQSQVIAGGAVGQPDVQTINRAQPAGAPPRLWSDIAKEQELAAVNPQAQRLADEEQEGATLPRQQDAQEQAAADARQAEQDRQERVAAADRLAAQQQEQQRQQADRASDDEIDRQQRRQQEADSLAAEVQETQARLRQFDESDMPEKVTPPTAWDRAVAERDRAQAEAQSPHAVGPEPRQSDVIDAIREQGGIAPPGPSAGGEYDAYRALPPQVKRALSVKGSNGVPIDVMAQALRGAAGSADSLMDEVSRAHVQRRVAAKDAIDRVARARSEGNAAAAEQEQQRAEAAAYRAGVPVPRSIANRSAPRPASRLTPEEQGVVDALRGRLQRARDRQAEMQREDDQERKRRSDEAQERAAAEQAQRVRAAQESAQARNQQITEEEQSHVNRITPQTANEDRPGAPGSQGRGPGPGIEGANQGQAGQGSDQNTGRDQGRPAGERQGPAVQDVGTPGRESPRGDQQQGRPGLPGEVPGGKASDRQVQGGSERGRVASQPVRSLADLHKGFRDVYGLPEDQAAAATALVRARADAMGMDPDEFARQHIAEVRRGKGSPSFNQNALMQQRQGTASGRRPHGPSRVSHTEQADFESDRRGADAAEKRLGPARIQTELAITMRGIDRVPILRAHNVPYGMGMDPAGRKAFIDPDFKTSQKLKLTGRVVNTIPPTMVHEITETRLMRGDKILGLGGMSYEQAHDIANAVEREYLRQKGLSKAEVDAYEREIEPTLRKTRDYTGPVPDELNRKPYEEEGETDLLRPPEQRGDDLAPNELAQQAGTRIIPRDESLAYQHLVKQWKKAHGDRTPSPTDAGWIDLQKKAAKIDAARGVYYQEDQLNDASGGSSGRVQKGAISFAQDGRAVIHALKAPDVSTAIHELGHLFRRTLSDRDQKIAGRWAGARRSADGSFQWTRNAEEKFARGFERWTRDGQAPIPALAKVFQQFKDWMGSIYRHLSGSPIDVQITPEIKDLFDRMFKPAEGAPVREAPKATEHSETTAPQPAAPAQEPAPQPTKDRTAKTFVNERPDLAIPTTDAATRKAYVKARNAMPDPEVQSRQGVRDQAKLDVARDPEGIQKQLLDLHDQGQAFNEHQMAQAQELLTRLRQRKGDNSPEFQRMSVAYQTSGTTGGRAQGIRADQLQTPEGRLAEAASIVGLPREKRARQADKLRQDIKTLEQKRDMLFQSQPDTARKMQSRIKRLYDKLDRVQAQDAKILAADKAHLKELGFDIDHPNPEWAQDPEQFRHFLGALEATRGGLPAAMRETYLGMLHMSGLVAGKKVVADSIGIPRLALQRHLEAAIAGTKRLATGQPLADQASAGELAALWKGLGPNLALAARNAWDTLKTERMPKELLGDEEVHQFPAIRGLKGKLFRHATQFTTVRTIDSFTRSFVANMEAHAQAYRSAVDEKGQRLTGDALASHIQNELGDYTSDSWSKARQTAMEATFTEKPPEIVRMMNRFKYDKANTITRKTLKVLANIMVPFSTIPSNIAKQGLRDWTPGISEANIIAQALTKRAQTGEWGYDPNKFNAGVAQAVMRWSAFLALGGVAGSGMITGADDERNPLSVNLFGHHFSYANLGPVARVIGAAADWYAPHKNDTTKAKAERVLAGSWHQFGEMPLIRLGADLAHAAKINDGWLRMAADKAGGFVEPSLVHQAITAQQDEVRAKTKVHGDAYDRFLGYMHDRLTGNKGKPVMVGGRPLVKDSFDSDMGTLAWRMFSPFTLGTKDTAKSQ